MTRTFSSFFISGIILASPGKGLEAATSRIALVIGNSKYEQLGNLTNTPKDARAINKTLREMGYATRLVLDANEQKLRREIRLFSEESEKADLALVFYAGHGAQVLGENYLLPIDMDLPKRESDIQLSAIKIDDVVTSIKSPTKVIFLDACRDNPALIKSLSKGRGSSFAGGLAPAKSTSAERSSDVGGIFVAYATDAGAVALDGGGEHSPFTEALLRHLKDPMSIDDMFSLVTREVRLSTRNAQRPYKYASLESIICLSQSCSASPASRAAPLNSVADLQAIQDSDYQLALNTNSTASLTAYLAKYPNGSKTGDVAALLRKLQVAPFDRWVMVERTQSGDSDFYMQPSSLGEAGDRVWINTRSVRIAKDAKFFDPDVWSMIATSVYDCKRRVWGTAQLTQLDANGQKKGFFVYGPPAYTNLPEEIKTGSLADQVSQMLCTGQIVPLVPPETLNSQEWLMVVSTPDGGVGYIPRQLSANEGNIKTFVSKLVYEKEKKVGYTPAHTIYLQRISIDCSEGKWISEAFEMYDAVGALVGKGVTSRTQAMVKIEENSPVSMIRTVVCSKAP